MRAAFPWYDLPSVHWANDQLWQATELPGTLDRHSSVDELMNAHDLLVTQACGLDLYLADASIVPIAMPVFELDCEPGGYFSYLLGDPAGRVAAVNSPTSRSGWTALLTMCAPEGVMFTGSHRASIEALRAGVADVAAIDVITYRILERDQPELISGFEPIERSVVMPAPPWVIRQGESTSVLAALTRATESTKSMAARQALFLQGLLPASLNDYAPVLAEYESVADRALTLKQSAVSLSEAESLFCV